MSNPTPQALIQGLGGRDDSVKLLVNGQQLLIAESWNVNEGVLSQPAGFSITIGSGDLAASLIQTFQPGPNYIFQLLVGNVLQQSGYLDAVMAGQPPGSATKVTLKGRDSLAPLQDTFVTGVIAANVKTYAQLAWFALQQVKLAPSGPIDPNILQTDNTANRSAKAGVNVAETKASQAGQEISAGSIASPPQARLHETWHQFLRRHFDRAGLFFWAANDGSFVLAAPNGNQAPTYLLRRKTGQPKDSLRANVVGMSFQDDRTHRHSEAIVYAKGGGKAFGRVKSKGAFDDDEMQASGYNQPIVFRDANCHNQAEAEFFARRKLAEERRSGWKLEYTVDGHTLPLASASNAAGGGQRAVLVPDTVVHVDDDELGFHENFYLESLDRQRGPQTTTTIRLMRLTDLIFGADEE
jgi:prophage tail gpP-like protein